MTLAAHSILAMNALELAQAIAAGDFSAREVLDAHIERIEATDAKINAFTRKSYARARREADSVDTQRSQCAALPPLAGVPYAVKNLFDIQSEVTLAGSKVTQPCTRPTGWFPGAANAQCGRRAGRLAQYG